MKSLGFSPQQLMVQIGHYDSFSVSTKGSDVDIGAHVGSPHTSMSQLMPSSTFIQALRQKYINGITTDNVIATGDVVFANAEQIVQDLLQVTTPLYYGYYAAYWMFDANRYALFTLQDPNKHDQLRWTISGDNFEGPVNGADAHLHVIEISTYNGQFRAYMNLQYTNIPWPVLDPEQYRCYLEFKQFINMKDNAVQSISNNNNAWQLVSGMKYSLYFMDFISGQGLTVYPEDGALKQKYQLNMDHWTSSGFWEVDRLIVLMGYAYWEESEPQNDDQARIVGQAIWDQWSAHMADVTIHVDNQPYATTSGVWGGDRLKSITNYTNKRIPIMHDAAWHEGHFWNRSTSAQQDGIGIWLFEGDTGSYVTDENTNNVIAQSNNNGKLMHLVEITSPAVLKAHGNVIARCIKNIPDEDKIECISF